MNITELIKEMEHYPNDTAAVVSLNDETWRKLGFSDKVAFVVLVNEDFTEICEDGEPYA